VLPLKAAVYAKAVIDLGRIGWRRLGEQMVEKAESSLVVPCWLGFDDVCGSQRHPKVDKPSCLVVWQSIEC
jgi:hypothetical protein